jgi:pimeloyl-ACP methyl ester carboxylesterase
MADARRTSSSTSRKTDLTQPAERYANLNGLRIHVLEWGAAEGKPIIALHGIARSACNFSHLAPRLSDRYRVIAVDMRGNGDSDWDPQGRYLVEDYASDIERLVDTLKLDRVLVWGNSTGGRVAQIYAGLHPDRVSGVIVEDVGPERPAAISDRRARRMKEEEGGWATREELVSRLRRDYPRTPENLLRDVTEHGTRVREDGRIVWKRDPAILSGFVPTELWGAVERITAPILYILGGASSIVPPETQDRLRRILPHARIVTMPGLGHYPSDEDAGAFLALVERFLADIP